MGFSEQPRDCMFDSYCETFRIALFSYRAFLLCNWKNKNEKVNPMGGQSDANLPDSLPQSVSFLKCFKLHPSRFLGFSTPSIGYFSV